MKKALFILLLGLLYIISLLPFGVLYLIADFLYAMLYYITRYRRKIIDQNLLNAFPEKNDEERKIIRKKYYHYLADLVVETVKLLSISDKQIMKRVDVTNANVVSEAFNSGKSVLGVLGHYGNWEMGALRFSQLFNEPRIIVYKALSNNYFDHLLYRMRSRFGATLVNMKNVARKLIEYKNERTVTVLVADQTPAKPEVNYFTNFLNQPTAVFLGVEKLARLTNSMVVFCDIRRIKRGYYRCTFVPLFADPKVTEPYEITNSHVKYLEEVIRQQPEYWLWSHRRWKFKPEDFGLRNHYSIG
ncbi:KDO2-lipid IV(A) lauroyltransferase [Mucilaginibacter gracilis]|uniref:KDO2-lipid IV(A) lauroyltransferase n=1 Tax=Mucilaginibacter gracilis TaxID=423350 RepID=A0A495JBG7_9SPHI|nr:lysophospholipid acyltransferase family protein [Mucilaginibacter gracilis]RKR85744.1 KDO2-lipid IV(A) lauroyltransferase [Mucilaginibacter gracilis]